MLTEKLISVLRAIYILHLKYSCTVFVQVHITQGDYDGKAVIITWVTANEPGSNIVQYGLSEGKYDFTAKGIVQNYTFYNYKSGYIHQCLVDGLQVMMC